MVYVKGKTYRVTYVDGEDEVVFEGKYKGKTAVLVFENKERQLFIVEEDINKIEAM